ncbi:unnamed protein product [Ceutorhynchus assimilis]|uniref:Uncharacterized protein n=1 Tax=Ceutorhynchus assimilis TaxID=467358 RepID=A0A9N9MZS5_9CUCU|nr:unnamed protein product [Ceutorhynchus assimilis]
MGPVIWWFIFVCLVVLITVLSLHLCCTVYQDNFRNNNKTKSITLNKYKFARTDVEDLTRMENFENYNPKIQFVNEVESPSVSKPNTPRMSRQRKGSLLPDIHEISDYSVEDLISESLARRNSEVLPRRFSLITEGMRKNSSAALPRRFSLKSEAGKSCDTLECLDPITIETKRDINNIEEEAQKIDSEIDYFLGASRNLKFFEINEKLIRLSLALSDLDCTSEELRTLKRAAQGYINGCKEKLNNKVV